MRAPHPAALRPRRTATLLAIALASACGSSPVADAGGGPLDASARVDANALADASAPTDGGSPPEVVTLLDVPYPPPDGVDGSRATLDLYYRPDGRPKRLVVLVHGGSWVSGDKRNFSSAAPDLIPFWLARDYVVAAVGFRLASRLGAPQIVVPSDQARDIAHALRWLHDHRAEHAVTEDGAVAFGFSSGAHLVALLGADSRHLAEVGLPPAHLGATISFDVHAYDVPYALSLMPGSVVEANIPLIEHLFGSTEAEQLEASPIAYVADGASPALLISAQPSPDEPGSHGYIVSRCAERYRAALEAASVTAEHHHYDDETHDSLVTDFGDAADGPTRAVDRFLADVGLLGP